MPDLQQLRAEAEAAIGAAGSAAELEELRVRYLGRKSELTRALRSIGELPPEQRGPVGKEANEVRRALEELLRERGGELEASELDRRLAQDRIDVTLPGDPPLPVGHLHLVSQIRRQMEDIFIGLGFSVLEGPEVEYGYYNFTSLNHPPDHPARQPQDTFYFRDSILLRTHTSPMQVRAMEAQEPPIYIVVPGRTYRPDTPDATHVPMFHQLEGLAVDEDITLADLQGTLLAFARAIFGDDRDVRLRPHFFPFTEPSVEVDVSCFRCGGSGELPDGILEPQVTRVDAEDEPTRRARAALQREHHLVGRGHLDVERARHLGPRAGTLRDGLDLDLVDGCSNANVEPAEESFLAKEVERERPGVTEPHRRLPGHLA